MLQEGVAVEARLFRRQPRNLLGRHGLGKPRRLERLHTNLVIHSKGLVLWQAASGAARCFGSKHKCVRDESCLPALVIHLL